MKIVDLSHELHTGMMVYPGDPEVLITPALRVEEDFVNVLSLHMGSQSGTHVDSPFHVRNDLAKLNELDLSLFVGRFALIDATGLAPREPIPHERFLNVNYAGCSIALVRTDWSEKFGDGSYLAHPFPTFESLELLLSLGIRTIGLDFLSLDMTPDDPSKAQLSNHYLWSEAGGVIAENLTNLRLLSADETHVSLLPLNLGPSDGAPVRAVAYAGGF